MISENRKLEFWNFLTSEKNQPRPKGITTQRLAVIKPVILSLDEVWLKIIGPDNTGERSAADFYESKELESATSRTEFWSAVSNLIRNDKTKKVENHPANPNSRRGRFNKVKTKRQRD